MSEINLDWRRLLEEDRLPMQTREWWEHQHISQSNNTTAKSSTTRQLRGNALFSINKATHWFIPKGQDKSQLGRWTWTRYQGKNIILYELLWHISRTHPMAPILNTPSMPSLTPSIDPYVQGRQFLRIWETTKNLYT